MPLSHRVNHCWLEFIGIIPKVGIMIIVDYSWGYCIVVSDYRYCTHGPVNIRITIAVHCHLPRFFFISWKWIFFVLPCFKYASSGDKQCIILANHFEQWINFLWQMCHKCVNCVLAWLEILNWFNQIHVNKPHCAAIGPESTKFYMPDLVPFWHIMAHMCRGCSIKE